MPTYKRLELHLGDTILHVGSPLIHVQSDHISPSMAVGQQLELNVQSLKLKSAAICGEAWMVFLLQLDDIDVENNFAIIPVFIDCWSN